mgnify:CR=1 FL=1
MKNFNILDCTLRDGGYYNNWNFSKNVIQNYLNNISKTSIKYIEIGFRFSKKDYYVGNTAYTSDQLLSNLKIPNHLKIGVMINASELIDGKNSIKTNLSKLFKKKNKKINFVRLACHFDEIPKLKTCLNWLRSKKYDVFVNIMQISEIDKNKIRSICKILSSSKIKHLYLADSLGALRLNKFLKIIKNFKKYWKFNLGLHAHNNLNKALENSVFAINNGFKWIDSTILGMGRGPGNLLTEDILKKYYPKDVKFINSIKVFHFNKLKKKYNWGSNKYYRAAALNKIHPTYIQEMLSEKRYRKSDYENIIQNLKKTDAKKYNPRKLFTPSNAFLGKPKGKWTPKNILKNKNVLIIGPGKTIEKNKEKIERYIDKKNLIVIALNTNTGISEELINFRLACHPLRIISDSFFHNNSRKPLIIPYSMLPKRLNEMVSIKNKLIYDFGLKVSKKKNFKIFQKFCIVQNPLAITYALSICKAGEVNNIFLAGFDGYMSDDPAIDETAFILKNYQKKFKKTIIKTLTPTPYNLEKSHI